jgi:hypothetical protein
MAVGCIDGLSGCAELMQVTQLVGNPAQGLGYRRADRGVPIGAHAHNGHGAGLLHLPDERGEVVWARREHAASQEYFPRETIAQDPEDLLAHIGVQTIKGEDDAARGLGAALEPAGVVEGQGDSCVVTFQQIGDGAGGDRHATCDQDLVDCGDTAVGAGALLADAGHDIAAKRVLGQRQASCLFGTVRGMPVRAGRIETAPHLESEPQERLEGGEGTGVMGGGPHGLATGGAVAQERLQGLRCGRDGSRGSPCPSAYLHESFYSWYRYHLPQTLGAVNK